MRGMGALGSNVRIQLGKQTALGISSRAIFNPGIKLQNYWKKKGGGKVMLVNVQEFQEAAPVPRKDHTC